MTTATDWAVGKSTELFISPENPAVTIYADLDFKTYNSSGTTINVQAHGSCTLFFNKGQIIYPFLGITVASNKTILATDKYNFIEIIKVG